MDDSSGLSQRISELYNSSRWHDIEFCLFNSCTGLPVNLYAHRLILAPCSEVLEALCFGPMAEKSTVVIPDVEPQAFEAMLQYLYTDKIVLTSVELASHILYCAKKYLVSSLANAAGQYLSNNLSDDNCIGIYNLAMALDENDIVKAAFEHISRRFRFVMEHFSFENVTLPLLLNLVTSKQLNCKEITLVVLAQMWAAHACETSRLEESSENLRKLLLKNNIFQNIKWHLISKEELSLVRPGLLHEGEISNAESANQQVLAPKRAALPLRLSAVYMTPITENSRIMCCHFGEGTTMTTTIKVNYTVFLRSLILIGKAPPDSDASFISSRMSRVETYTDRLEVTLKCNDQILTSLKFSQVVSYEVPFQLHLGEDIVLHQNAPYDIEIRFLTDRNKSLFKQFTSNSIRNPHGLSVSCEKFVLKNHPSAGCYSFIAGFLFSY